MVYAPIHTRVVQISLGCCDTEWYLCWRVYTQIAIILNLYFFNSSSLQGVDKWHWSDINMTC